MGSFSVSLASPINTNTLHYDANGNLIEGFGKTYDYNEFNNLVKIKDKNTGSTIESYVYDHEGNRIKKVTYNPDGSLTTTYYPDSNFIRVVDNSGTHDTIHYYDDSSLVARKDRSGTYFYHPDHLGSTNIVTDLSGNVVERTEYLPFGEVLKGGQSRYLFTGKEKDSTDLMYYGARYYDPFTRHFTQADTILPDIYDPLQLNRYAYVMNNPVRYTDPTGNTPWSAIAGVVGFGANLIKQIILDSRSIFSGTIDWGEAATVGVSSTIATSVGITSFGLTSSALSSAGVGYVTGTTLSGIASGGIGAASYQTTSNLISGRSVTENVYESSVFGAKVGGVLGFGGGAGTAGLGVLRQAGSKVGIGSRNIFSNTRNFGTKSLTDKNSILPKYSPHITKKTDMEILPFKQRMEFGKGKLYGSKTTAIIHENYRGFNLDYHYHSSIYAPGKMELSARGYKNNPIQKIVFDDLTKGGVKR